MIARTVLNVVIATLLATTRAFGQISTEPASQAERFIDPVNGLPLEQAIRLALQQEPSLRSARSDIEVARGMQTQASLRPNPSISFEQRTEPGGSDSQTMVSLEWPLELFRRGPRVAVAEREVITAELAASNRERLLATDVRTRYGDLLAHVRDLALLDELVAVTRRQHRLLEARVDEGASPPLERNVTVVELRRLAAEQLLQIGRTEAALFDLKRVLGMKADAMLSIRDTLDTVVERELSVRPAAADVSTLVEERVDVREAAARVDVARAKVDRALSDGRFDVNLFGGYTRMDAAFPQRGVAADGTLAPIRGRFHYVSAGATLMLPLLNRNQGEVAAAQAERARVSAAQDAIRLSAEAEIAAARARDERARQAVQVYSGGAHTLARQNLTVVGQSYELGRVTVFEVLAEQRRYLEVERAYTEALRAAFDARTALNLALGEVR
jgi:cobalt-zinc-cadmium efflux system outer membrane protein